VCVCKHFSLVYYSFSFSPHFLPRHTPDAKRKRHVT
jgi:hypothetical protein